MLQLDVVTRGEFGRASAAASQALRGNTPARLGDV